LNSCCTQAAPHLRKRDVSFVRLGCSNCAHTAAEWSCKPTYLDGNAIFPDSDTDS
jgi:hypothetical protein